MSQKKIRIDRAKFYAGFSVKSSVLIRFNVQFFMKLSELDYRKIKLKSLGK